MDTDSRDRLQRIARQAMRARGLLPDFSAQASWELDRISAPAVPAAPHVRDLRGLLWVSIDNDDSRDLDQLSVAETLADRAVRILVAIADVDALVHRASALDEHARANTTSVYTVPQVFPMLPEKLSTDLTSLAQGQDRLAIVIDMTIRADGTMDAADLYPAFVRNQAKLAYSAVGPWLEGRAPVPASVASLPGLDQQLQIQDAAAQALKAVRQTRGALTLETIEASPVFDGDRLTDLRPQAKNRAHELIEDFMIAAKVERQVGKAAAALLLLDQVGKRFDDAIVTGAADKGTWVRIANPTVEGKLVRGFEGLEVGDRLRVQLLHTDVERGFIDFERVR